jgi:hypothetical protein
MSTWNQANTRGRNHQWRVDLTAWTMVMGVSALLTHVFCPEVKSQGEGQGGGGEPYSMPPALAPHPTLPPRRGKEHGPAHEVVSQCCVA